MQLKKDLTLHQAVEIARQADQVKNQITQQHEASQLEEIRRNKKTFNNLNKPKTKFNQNLSEKSKKRTCGRCNTTHEWGKCPAYQQICHKCSKKGHFAVCCRTKPVNRKKYSRPSHDVKEVDCDEENDTPMFLGLVNDVTNTKSRPWIVYLLLQGKQVEFKVDCGADVTVINNETYASLPV